jgi:hypothetical protein
MWQAGLAASDNATGITGTTVNLTPGGVAD